jgi:hypothetical protein
MSPSNVVPAVVRTGPLQSSPDLLKSPHVGRAASSSLHRIPICEIDVPLARYPNLANAFRQIPIVVSRAPTLRMVYSAGSRS